MPRQSSGYLQMSQYGRCTFAKVVAWKDKDGDIRVQGRLSPVGMALSIHTVARWHDFVTVAVPADECKGDCKTTIVFLLTEATRKRCGQSPSSIVMSNGRVVVKIEEIGRKI